MQVSVALAGLAIGVAVCLVLIWQLNSRWRTALGGANAKDLESSLKDYFGRIKELESKATSAEEAITNLSQRLDLASQKISIVRFNPFGDTGGDQSFSLAVLDANSSGYVLTSIHSRENTRTYIKPIDGGVSKYTLSKEEKQAMDQAAKRVPKR